MADDNYLQDLIRGDKLAWRAAFKELHPIALRVARMASWGLSEADANEVASDVLREISSKVGKIDTYEGLKALTVTISRRRSISLLRKNTAKIRGRGLTSSLQEARGEDSQEIQVPDSEPTPAEDLVKSDLIKAVRGFLRTLDGKVRKVVECIYVEDLSYKETGEKLDMPTSTVGVYLSRGLMRLRREFEENPVLMKYFQELLR